MKENEVLRYAEEQQNVALAHGGDKDNKISRLNEAIFQLEGYQNYAKSGWLELIIHDLKVLRSEMAGEERPELRLEHENTWIGFGMDKKPEIKITF